MSIQVYTVNKYSLNCILKFSVKFNIPYLRRNFISDCFATVGKAVCFGHFGFNVPFLNYL